MAIFSSDPFPGTNYAQYLNWEKVTAPNGQTFYVVPGQPGYVYDPVASNATGRKVFRANPKLAIQKQAEEEKRLAEAQKQAAFNASPLGQILPVAAGTGGIIAASKLTAPGATAVQALKDGSVLMSDGTIKGAQAAAVQTAAEAAAQGATGVSGIGPVASGSQYASSLPGTTVPETLRGAAPAEAGLGITPYLGLAGAGIGAYGLHNAIEANDPTSGALSGAGMGLGLGAAAPLLGFGPLGWAGLAGAAALGGLGGFGLTSAFGQKSTKEIEQDRWKDSGAPAEIASQMAGRDYFAGTGGEKSRDEKFLTADAIRYNPENFRLDKDWATRSKEFQDSFLNSMLQAGKVQEKKGGIYYDDDFAATQYNNLLKGATTPAQAAAQGALNKPLVRPVR